MKARKKVAQSTVQTQEQEHYTSIELSTASYYDLATTGMDLLYESARDGSVSALNSLREIADLTVQRAGG